MYYPMYFDPTYILVLIGVVICLIASARVKSTFNKYSRYRSMSGMTGAQAAERILNSAGIYDVTVCKEVTDFFQNLGTFDKYVLAVLIHDKVYISLTITHICICQSMEFLRKNL